MIAINKENSISDRYLSIILYYILHQCLERFSRVGVLRLRMDAMGGRDIQSQSMIPIEPECVYLTLWSKSHTITAKICVIVG